MFRKTLEHHLGKEIFPKPMDKKDEVSKIVVHVSESKDKPDHIIAELDKHNFSVNALDAMLSALKSYDLECKADNKINYKIKIYSGYWTNELVHLILKTNHNNLDALYYSTKTLIEGLKKYKQIMGAKYAEIL